MYPIKLECVIVAASSYESLQESLVVELLQLVQQRDSSFPVLKTQVCFTSGEFITARGMSPAISLDDAADGAFLGEGEKPLYVSGWPRSRRGHCAGLC